MAKIIRVLLIFMALMVTSYSQVRGPDGITKGGSIFFDGVDDYVWLEDNTGQNFPTNTFNYNNVWSMSIWIRSYTATTGELWFGCWTSNGWIFWNNGGFIGWQFYGNARNYYATDIGPRIGQWDNVVTMYNGGAAVESRVRMWVNGIERTVTKSGTGTNGANYMSTAVKLAPTGISANFKGNLDNMCWWTRLLTPREIAYISKHRLTNKMFNPYYCFNVLSDNKRLTDGTKRITGLGRWIGAVYSTHSATEMAWPVRKGRR